MKDCIIRSARPTDQAAAYYVCLKTGDFGKDGEPYYREDPDALGRIFVGHYLAYEPELSLVLEDDQGVCGYALGAFDSRAFYARYERKWRPELCKQFSAPQGDPNQWTRVQTVYHWYHNPDYTMPEPYEAYPSHLHIDLLARAPARQPGRAPGRQHDEYPRVWILPAAGLPGVAPRRRGQGRLHLHGQESANTGGRVNPTTGLLNKCIVPALTALSENTYLSAIRAGMVSVVPLTIIGGLSFESAFQSPVLVEAGCAGNYDVVFEWEKWTPFIGPRNAEIKLGFRVCWN